MLINHSNGIWLLTIIWVLRTTHRESTSLQSMNSKIVVRFYRGSKTDFSIWNGTSKLTCQFCQIGNMARFKMKKEYETFVVKKRYLMITICPEYNRPTFKVMAMNKIIIILTFITTHMYWSLINLWDLYIKWNSHFFMLNTCNNSMKFLNFFLENNIKDHKK